MRQEGFRINKTRTKRKKKLKEGFGVISSLFKIIYRILRKLIIIGLILGVPAIIIYSLYYYYKLKMINKAKNELKSYLQI